MPLQRPDQGRPAPREDPSLRLGGARDQGPRRLGERTYGPRGSLDVPPRGATFWPVQQHKPRLSRSTCDIGLQCWHPLERNAILVQMDRTIDRELESELSSRYYAENRCCWCGEHASRHKLDQVEHGPYRPLRS